MHGPNLFGFEERLSHRVDRLSWGVSYTVAKREATAVCRNGNQRGSGGAWMARGAARRWTKTLHEDLESSKLVGFVERSRDLRAGRV
jgi:hypothetical protein